MFNWTTNMRFDCELVDATKEYTEEKKPQNNYLPIKINLPNIVVFNSLRIFI